MDSRVEKLISAISRLREFSHTQEDLKEVKRCINLIFNPDVECVNFVYTVNTDKLPFGCVVFPVLNAGEINNFLIVGEPVKISKVECEIDSKLFDYGLTDEQVAQIILFNIYHMTKNMAPCDNVREMIDDFFVMSGNQLIIKSSIQYQAILTLGLVDALSQVSSCLCLPDEVVNDAFLESLGLNNFKDTLDKIYAEIPDCTESIRRIPNLSMLQWALRLYCDVNKERIPAIHLLNKAKELTASNLYINKFNIAINALNRIDTDLLVNESVQQVFTEAKRKGGLLASLKYNGLRDIESDLYEFQLRAKNAETEQEVLYALKQINARLAILDDYIREYPDDPEIDRWIAVKMEYIEIRDVLAKKKLHKRSYGIFIDYDAIDKAYDSENESAELLDESFLIIDESADSTDRKLRKNAVNNFKKFFKKAMIAYSENSKIKKSDINDIALRPTEATRDFINGKSNYFEFKIGSIKGDIQINILVALLTGFVFIKTGRKAFNRAVVKATASKKDLCDGASEYCGIEITDISVCGKKDKFLKIITK